jgi:hypothetical protein
MGKLLLKGLCITNMSIANGLNGNPRRARIVHRRLEGNRHHRKGFPRWSLTIACSTAAHFERLAQKEVRDYDRRQRLLEVARFYRSLAGIIPGMPEAYKSNSVGLPLTRAERWHARAEECRTLADCFTDQTCREQLRGLAQEYDRMAEAAG